MREVLTSILPILDIVEITNDAWWSLDLGVFEAAWVVTGYFSTDHFRQFRVPEVSSMAEARDKLVMNPAGILTGSGLKPTPQFCTQFEWQLKDWVPGQKVCICFSCLTWCWLGERENGFRLLLSTLLFFWKLNVV